MVGPRCGERGCAARQSRQVGYQMPAILYFVCFVAVEPFPTLKLVDPHTLSLRERDGIILRLDRLDWLNHSIENSLIYHCVGMYVLSCFDPSLYGYRTDYTKIVRTSSECASAFLLPREIRIWHAVLARMIPKGTPCLPIVPCHLHCHCSISQSG